MVWSQAYNPLGNAWVSTLVAAVPIVVLLGVRGMCRSHHSGRMDSVAAVGRHRTFQLFFVGVNSTLAHGLDASPALLAHTDEVIE